MRKPNRFQPMKITQTLLTFASLCSFSAAATTFVSNLSEPTQTMGLGAPWGQATSFTTGSTGSFDVNQVTLSVNNTDSGVSVKICTYTVAGPGATLAVFTTSSTTAGLRDFTAPTITLTADTSYFVVATAASYVGTLGANTANQTSADGWTIGDVRYYSPDNGVNFYNSGSLPVLSFSLGNAVPEPSSLLIAMSGLMVFFRRR